MLQRMWPGSLPYLTGQNERSAMQLLCAHPVSHVPCGFPNHPAGSGRKVSLERKLSSDWEEKADAPPSFELRRAWSTLTASPNRPFISLAGGDMRYQFSR
jgi:hypothetical protein